MAHLRSQDLLVQTLPHQEHRKVNSVVMLGKQNSSSTLTHLKPRNSTSSMEQAPMQLSQNEEEDYEEEIDSEGDEYSDCSDEEKCDETSTTKSNRPTRKAKEQGSIKTKMFIQGLESDEI
ncbi:hypothetical protein C9374_010285 [Naegleria lovaniensis]|uniref:Uncharacterized protein n=1 Tax=Naegleria lovaniensis TaxID=51637 RepID=A0AA88GIT3_NAELO|nr:uncharacterized protein C9374_010285 [Naegleria lovaniensis]KAG2374911.1 hypothetical protein C9374_010285 [Naegleria lovaniensis]